MVTVSAPGKCIIIGEHAVVYGKPAILAAIGLRTTVAADRADDVRYKDTQWNHDDRWSLEDVRATTKHVQALWQSCAEKKNFTELFADIKANRYENYKKAIMGILLEKLDIDGGIAVEIKSDVPVGAGCGSSASRHVALAKAAALAYDQERSDEEINDVAYALEQIIHGTPSGGDNAACCFGGLLWFRKAQPKNEILSLRDQIPYTLKNFVLVNVGTPEKTTGELVQQVRDLDEAFRTTRMDALENLTVAMLDALKHKDFDKMKHAMNSAQQNLAELTVSTPAIDGLCASVREAGGAAKLCGAGGGGVVLCWHDDVDMLKKTIIEKGHDPIETTLAVEGVRAE